MEAQRYVRKPFFVEAVRVTKDNMEAVADWCGGKVQWAEAPHHKGSKPRPYIKVDVVRPINERQTMAFANDWVLMGENGAKVYSEKTFRNSFDPTPENLEDK